MRILSFKTFSVFSGSHKEPQLQNCVKLWWTWWGWGCVCMCLCVCLCVYIAQVRVEMGGNCLWNKPKKSMWPVKLASVLSSPINCGPEVLCPSVQRQSLLWPFTLGLQGCDPKLFSWILDANECSITKGWGGVFYLFQINLENAGFNKFLYRRTSQGLSILYSLCYLGRGYSHFW